MAAEAPLEPTARERPSGATRGAALVALLIALLVVQAPGCSCRTETEAERVARLAREEAERIEREKRELEEQQRRAKVVLPPARMQPSGDAVTSLFVKPGHWNAIVQPAKANAEDFDGRISHEIVGRKNEPRLAPGARKRLVSERPLVVARESFKSVESLFYCPPTGRQTPRLRARVRERRGGALRSDSTTPLTPLLDHQYHFVVLSDDPKRYAFLDSLYAFTAPVGASVDTTSVTVAASALPATKNYRLVAPPLDDATGAVAVPDTALAWSSIAYVLWDGADPASLRPDQQDAIIDWLNWGGQLIVSGPDSLDLLRGSFLAPWLPAESAGTREIPDADLRELEASWRATARGKSLAAKPPWLGVRLDPAKQAAAIPGTAGLLVERRVGRGRIVVSAFTLNQPQLLGWHAGVENLYNAALLRRPPRRFATISAGFEADAANEVVVRWANKEHPLRFDPLLNTGVRGFVRDTHANPDELVLDVVDEASVGGGVSGFRLLKPAVVPGGAGAVNDYNATAAAARESLRESAGVSVPDSGFVVACLAIYLALLVPANWLLFSALGRVELAWVAAPLIALAGAWAVVQQAQLDIGFVRAQTEVGVLELQPDTPRGLLTRFTALYTSLSTTYEMEFDAPAVAAPFPAGGPDEEPTDTLTALVFERQEKTRLKNIAVSSASTELLRSEEMIDIAAAGVPGSSVPGSITLSRGPTGPRLQNRLAWTVHDAVVLRRPAGVRAPEGAALLEGCWIGRVEPGEAADVVFLPIDAGFATQAAAPLPFAEERAEAARLDREPDEERLRLDGLERLAIDPNRFEPGETRVVARIDGVLPGVRVEPAASQRRGATLLVSHLAYGPLPPTRSDLNAPTYAP